VKLAFVTPRYGADVADGPAHACRLFAERLARRHDVDVLTTCATDPRGWKNTLTEGSDRVRGVLVRRFAVSQQGTGAAPAAAPGARPAGREAELAWLRRRGPWSPGLHEYLSGQSRGYDAVVYFSLLQPAVAHGFGIAPERTVVFPYLAPDRCLRFGLWREVLDTVRGVGYFSAAERRLARRYIGATPRDEDTVGIGVADAAPLTYPRHQQDPADDATVDDAVPREDEDDAPPPAYLEGRGIPFRRRHRLYGPLAAYTGRVAPGHGFEALFEYFDAYASTGTDTRLGLFGPKLMRVPDAPFVRMGGVVPDRQRMAAFEGADVVLAPSHDDLLSLPMLESLAIGTPVLASARNLAAVEHCRASNGGLYYANADEFAAALTMLMRDPDLRAGLGENGRDYVRQHCRWDAALARFERLVGDSGNGGPRHRRHH
jgi:glycosyltransferase involved in cell wall biosynthesis